jgi:hypothetical protein
VVRKELEKQFVHWKFVVIYISSISLANITRITGISSAQRAQRAWDVAGVSISTGTINCEFLLFLFLFFSRRTIKRLPKRRVPAPQALDKVMLGAARLLRLSGANVRSSDPLSRTIIKAMSTKVFVLPLDPTSQPGSGVLPSVDPLELWNTAPTGSKPPKVGTTRIFYNTPRADRGDVSTTAVVSLGEGFDKKSDHARRELVRKAVGSGVKQVKELGDGTKDIVVDASTDAHAAGRPILF